MCFVCVRVHTHSEGLASLLIYMRVFFIKKYKLGVGIKIISLITIKLWMLLFDSIMYSRIFLVEIYKRNILSYTKLKEKLTLIKLAAVVSTGASQHEGLDISINTECWQHLKLNLALTFLYYSFIFSLFLFFVFYVFSCPKYSSFKQIDKK